MNENGPPFNPNCDQRISVEFHLVAHGSSDSTSYSGHKVMLVLLSGSNVFVNVCQNGFCQQ